MNLTDDLPLLPVFLGGGLDNYSYIHKYSMKYDIRPTVFGKSDFGSFIFSLLVDFHKLRKTIYPELIIMALRDFAVKHNDELLLLVPTNEYFRSIIRDNADKLEDLYLINYDICAGI